MEQRIYGSCVKDKNGAWQIDKEWYGQSFVFKDYVAWEHGNSDAPVYVPELSDTVYTKQDIIDIAGGNEKLADCIFDMLDWAHPDSLLEDLKINGEIAICPKCGYLEETYEREGTILCAKCGAEMQEA